MLNAAAQGFMIEKRFAVTDKSELEYIYVVTVNIMCDVIEYIEDIHIMFGKMLRLFGRVKVTVSAVQIAAVVDAYAGTVYHQKRLPFLFCLLGFLLPVSR